MLWCDASVNLIYVYIYIVIFVVFMSMYIHIYVCVCVCINEIHLTHKRIFKSILPEACLRLFIGKLSFMIFGSLYILALS